MTVNPTVLAARAAIDLRDLTARVTRTTAQLAQAKAAKPLNPDHATAIATLIANKEAQLVDASAKLTTAQQTLAALAPKT